MIRPYTEGDLETIADIGDRAWRGIHDMFRQVYGPELFEILVPDDKRRKGDRVGEHCRSHPEWVLVCEEEGRVVGFATFFIDAETKVGVIGNNAVDPECGLKGIGQQMSAAVSSLFKEKGMLFAQVRTGLDEAHAPARAC